MILQCTMGYPLTGSRCLCIQSGTRQKPFAISGDFVPPFLPLEADKLDLSFGAAAAHEPVGIFGRQAQACRLLDRVVSVHARQAVVPLYSLDSKKAELDDAIRRLMGILIDQNGGTVCDYCEASAIVLA